jgi:hypothetical protein
MICGLTEPFTSRFKREDVPCLERRPIISYRAGVFYATDDASAVAAPYGVTESVRAARDGVRYDAVDERLRRDLNFDYNIISKPSEAFEYQLFTIEAQGMNNVYARLHKAFIFCYLNTVGIMVVKVG